MACIAALPIRNGEVFTVAGRAPQEEPALLEVPGPQPCLVAGERVGDPVPISVEPGFSSAGHTTQFKTESRLSWQDFKDRLKGGAAIRVELTSTISWQLQTARKIHEISIMCDPSPREEERIRQALLDFEQGLDDEGKPAKASYLHIFCRDNQ